MTAEQRKALQVTSAFLAMIAEEASLSTRHATIRHEGKVIAVCTIAEALDMANEALEPATQGE